MATARKTSLPPDFQPMQSCGLGMKVIQAQVRQLGGSLDIYRNDHGVAFIATFPAPPKAQELEPGEDSHPASGVIPTETHDFIAGEKL